MHTLGASPIVVVAAAFVLLFKARQNGLNRKIYECDPNRAMINRYLKLNQLIP